MASESVIGLDLSLRRTGWAIIPYGWGGDCSMVRVGAIECAPVEGDSCDTAAISRILNGWTERVGIWSSLDRMGLLSITKRADHIGIESLPTHGFSITRLARLHGALRYALNGPTWDVQQATARKLLLGSVPRKDLKRVVRETVNSFPGAESWGPDECDAFVVANWLCCELGWQFIAAGPTVTKARKR